MGGGAFDQILAQLNGTEHLVRGVVRDDGDAEGSEEPIARPEHLVFVNQPEPIFEGQMMVGYRDDSGEHLHAHRPG
jgi:hypothetical protein